MVAHGIKGMVTLNGEPITRQIFGQFRAEAAKVGPPPAGRGPGLGRRSVSGGVAQEAIDGVRPYHDERYKWFAPFGFVRYADEHGRAWGTPARRAGVPTIEEGVRQKAWLVGPPHRVIELLQELELSTRPRDIVLHWPEGMSAADWQHQLRRSRKSDARLPARRGCVIPELAKDPAFGP